MVVLPLPTRGHVNPMMHFCKILAAQGLSITFVNSEHNDSLVVHTEREALQRLGIRLEVLPDGLPAHVDRTTHVLDLCESLFSAMPRPFEALLARLLHHDPAPSCILADTWLTFTLDAASKFGLPHANFWTQSAASFASLLMVANGSYTGPSQGEPHIPGALSLKEEDMNTFARCYDRSNFMFRFVTGGFDRLNESRWIFINSFHELECETLEALRKKEGLHTLLDVGPLLSSSLLTHDEADSYYPQTNDVSTIWAEEEDCLTWLDQFEPKSVVFVSFGSLALVTSQQIEEIALGLEASGHPFLWVTRPDLIYGESPNFNEDYLERVKDKAYFVSWAPQLKVLSHRAVGGFFTHGGWNSTVEAISLGVPMLGWPYFSDQPMDCKCIEEEWNVGLRLRKGGSEMLVRRNVVETKVKELMSSHKFLKKAHEWSSLAKKAALEGGSSFKNIRGFVDTLKSPS